MQQFTYKSVFQASWRIDVKKLSVSYAAAAVLALTAVTGAVAAELPAYEKAGLPVSAVQLQVMGAEGVSEAPASAMSATPVQLSVLTPRHKTKTAEVPSETTGRAIH
jgi:predicted component of type VI protein secretion system